MICDWPAMSPLYDEASGVRVHGDVGVLPSDTVLQVADQSLAPYFQDMPRPITLLPLWRKMS